MGRPEGKRPLGRHRLRRKHNIRLDLNSVAKAWTVLIWFHRVWGIFLTSFSRRTVYHGASYLCFAIQPKVKPLGLGNGDTVYFMYVGTEMLKYYLDKLHIY